MAITVAATFCATLVDEWARAGCTDAVVAPGSRSTPLALALAADDRMAVHVFHDERAASYAALGLALATGRPAPLLCTSGTATTHFHGAVVEAGLSNVPMLVCTADRPPELRQVGAPQTIDQVKLYGDAVRFFADPGVPDDAARASWRSLASRVVAEAMGASGRPGPVHLNLAFRDPLVGVPGPLPADRAGGAGWHRWDRRVAAPLADITERVADVVRGRRGVIVAGAGSGDPAGVAVLAERLGWPVLADHRSGCRSLPSAVAHADPLLRVAAFARDRRPQVVLRFGQPLASKVVNQWLTAGGAEHVAVDAHGAWWDPDRTVGEVIRADPSVLARQVAECLGDVQPSADADAWRAADAAAAGAIGGLLAPSRPASEPGTVGASLDAAAADGALVVASSMPVRDLEWFTPPREDVAVFANRGANGIDGVVSTAIGVALSGRPTVCVLGDVAFLHDATSLIALARRAVDLTVVVVDNDGGGIFSFLPQARELPTERFEQLFGTPHGTDCAALARAHGLRAVTAEGQQSEVSAAITAAVRGGGPAVVVVRTERTANVALHAELERAVAAAVSGGDRLG